MLTFEVLLEEKLEDRQSQPLVKPHGNLSKSQWDIWIWNKVVH